MIRYWQMPRGRLNGPCRLLQSIRQVFGLSSVILGAMALVSAPVSAQGIETAIDVSKHFSEHMADVVEARVVALPPGYYFIYKMTEEMVNKFGCSYPARTSREIAELMDILVAGQVVEVPKLFQFGPDPRIIVYLKMRDDRMEKLMLESTLDKPMQVYGVFDGTDVRAMSPNFPKLLRAWAASRQPVITPTCEQGVLHSSTKD